MPRKKRGAGRVLTVRPRVGFPEPVWKRFEALAEKMHTDPTQLVSQWATQELLHQEARLRLELDLDESRWKPTPGLAVIEGSAEFQSEPESEPEPHQFGLRPRGELEESVPVRWQHATWLNIPS